MGRMNEYGPNGKQLWIIRMNEPLHPSGEVYGRQLRGLRRAEAVK